jgi:hypothetical protein
MHASMCVCVCVFVYMYIYIYMYVYIHTSVLFLLTQQDKWERILCACGSVSINDNSLFSNA